MQAAKALDAPLVGGPLGSAHLFGMGFDRAFDLDRPIDPADEVSSGIRERFRLFAKAAGISSLDDCKGRLVVSLGLAAARFYNSVDWRRSSFGNLNRHAHLSLGVLEAIVRTLQAPTMEFLTHCVKNDLVFAAVAGPSPQKRHPAVIALGAAPVIRLVDLYEKPVRDLLDRHGIPIVSLRSSEGGGLLAEHFWGNDAAHGNLEYGKEVVRAIARLRDTARSGTEATATQPPAAPSAQPK